MGPSSQISVSVAGGSTETNNQLASIIHQSLMEKGFTNVGINSFDAYEDARGISVHHAAQMANPELFNTPIFISGEVSHDGDFQREALAVAAARSRPTNYINALSS